MSLSTRSARCAALMAEPDELYPGGNFRRKELTEQRFHLYLFLFFFSRKDYIPQEYENVDQNSCRRRQTNRREDMHGNSLIFLFLFPFEFFKNAFKRVSQALRTLVFGSCATPPRPEWARTGFTLRPYGQSLAFGLRAPRNTTRALVTAVQAVMLKHFLFKSKQDSHVGPERFLKNCYYYYYYSLFPRKEISLPFAGLT